MCFHYYLFTWKNFCLLLSSFLEMFFSCSLLCVLPLDVSIYVLFLPRPWKCTCPLLYFTWKCICPIVCSYLMKYLSVVVTTVCCCCWFFFTWKYVCPLVTHPTATSAGNIRPLRERPNPTYPWVFTWASKITWVELNFQNKWNLPSESKLAWWVNDSLGEGASERRA